MRKIGILILGLGIFFNVHHVFAQNVSLKTDHNVGGDFLKLSDFFNNVPAEIDEEIIESPTQGSSRHYPYDWVKELAENFGLKWCSESYEGITLTRPKHEDRSQNKKIEQMITDYVCEQDKSYEDAKVILDKIDENMLTENQEPVLLNFSWLQGEKFTANFNINGKDFNVQGSLFKMIYLPVLKKDKEPGDLIAKDDLEFKPFYANKITSNPVKYKEDLIGKTIQRRLLKAGDLISPHDVISPVVIKRGDLVTIKIETPYMMITTKGKAQANAKAGESIQVLNIESKRLVEGIAKDSQTVIVPVYSR